MSGIIPTPRPTLAQLLALEERYPASTPAKEKAIDDLGIGAGRYYQLVNQMIDNPAAQAANPMTTNRLRRIRDAAVEARTTRLGR